MVRVFSVLDHSGRHHFERHRGHKISESYAAPLLLLGGIILLVWASSTADGLGNVLSNSSCLAKTDKQFLTVFPAR